MNEETIFIGIPSIKDTELIPTVLNAINDSENRNRIFIGIAYTTEFSNKKLNDSLSNALKNFDNVSFNFFNLNKYHGAGWGRIHASELYNDQDYYLQIDSHMLFDKNWDTKLIKIFKDAKERVKNKIVISGYPTPYSYNVNSQRKVISDTMKLTCPKYVDGNISDRFDVYTEYMNMLPNWEDFFPEIIWENDDEIFFPSPKVSGGFTFGDKEFAKNYKKYYPYPPMFYDEEIIQSVELINDGYEIVCPSVDIPIAHLYSDNINENGGERDLTSTHQNKVEQFIKKYKEYLNQNKEKINFYKEKTGMNLLTNNVEFKMPAPDWFIKK